jgi:hypothetical protein
MLLSKQSSRGDCTEYTVQLQLSAVQAGITLVTVLLRERERGVSGHVSAAFFGEISQMLARNDKFSRIQIFLVI